MSRETIALGEEFYSRWEDCTRPTTGYSIHREAMPYNHPTWKQQESNGETHE